jgi:RNA polymerase sigma-70 factor, ECF subfamily
MTVVATATDSELLARLRAGDENAFVELIDTYHATLTRLARLYVADSAAAEDVVQETWMGLLRGLDRFEARASIKTWLSRILVNRARTRGRRDRRSVPFSALIREEVETDQAAVDPARFRPANDPEWPGHWLMAPAEDELPEQRLLAGELTARVRATVEALPAAQREVVTLRDIEGWSSDEVCSILNVSEGNQRVLLHRGRAKVRGALEEYMRGESSAARAK